MVFSKVLRFACAPLIAALTLAFAFLLVAPGGAVASASAVSAPARSLSEIPSAPGLGWSAPSALVATELEGRLGLRPAALGTFVDFNDEFPTDLADAAALRGVPLVLAWEPWDSDTRQPYLLSSLAAGEYDEYMRSFAASVAASPARVLIRFAPEINGTWAPWYSSPEDFIAAWRHAHDLFAALGVTNAKWVWNPSVFYPSMPRLSTFYPGSQYVDWLALDGYDFGGVLPGHKHLTPAEVFDLSLKQFAKLDPRLPVMLAETAAPPSHKTAWVSALARYAPRTGIDLVMWFEHDKETDWRLSSAQFPRPLPVLLAANGWRVTPVS